MYRALSRPERRQILDEVVERDGLTLFDICGRLIVKHQNSSTRQAISQHLTVLEDANLVRSHRDGRTEVPHLNAAPLREIPQRWPTND